MIDIDYTTDISQKMQVPNRLSLIMPNTSSSDSIGRMEVPDRVVVSGSKKVTELHDPYDIQISKPSLDAPPQSLVLGQFDYPDIDRISRNRFPPVDGSRDTSNLSLFHGSLNGLADDERTLIDANLASTTTQIALSHPPLVAPAGLESQLQELMVRVSVLEEAITTQHRRELLTLILLGTYFLLKLGRSLL